MRSSRLLILAFAASSAAPAMAFDDYYDGWAVPTMETSLEIGRLAAEREVQLEILRDEAGRGRSAPAAAQTAAGSFFSAALAPARAVATPAVNTRFSRSSAVEQRAHASILNALQKRQPEAVPEFRRLFATANLPAGFEDVLRPYGLSANDAADALTAYWVMAWVVAHRIADDSGLPSPQAVAGVRSQVGQGFALTPAGRYDATRRQLLADEAIFNFLVLNQAWRSARKDPAQFDRLAAATQRNFLALGTDLGQLAAGPDGFVQR